MSTLREELERRQQTRQRFTVAEIVRLMVPLCTELSEHHTTKIRLFVHPSSVSYDEPEELHVDVGEAQLMPENPRDRACLPPESKKGEPGDARASVFSIGAMLYEMLTGASVGPGMRRPSDLVPGTPSAFEVLLGKALVSDPQHRPSDLGALAKALHNCSPGGSNPPPSADESHLDHDDDFEVDVSLSLIPPPDPEPQSAPLSEPLSASLAEPLGGIAAGVHTGDAHASTQQLAEMKAALEADPRPRYVVVKDGMDHGPFTAVEMLQQIATCQFRIEHFLRDVLSGDERQLAEWDEFAPFAHQAAKHKEAQKERTALERSATADQHSVQNKALIMGGVLLVIAAGFGGWWLQSRATKDDTLAVKGGQAQNIEADGKLKEGEKGGPGGPGGKWKGGGPGSGSHPVIAGGQSCEAARAAYVEAYNMGGDKTPPDLSAGAYGAVLNRGTYLNSCGVPPDMAVSICAAVQNGRAVGVTVRTTPADGRVAGCVKGAVMGMSFPSHPRMDVSTTTFKAGQ